VIRSEGEQNFEDMLSVPVPVTEETVQQDMNFEGIHMDGTDDFEEGRDRNSTSMRCLVLRYSCRGIRLIR
jgi:hypothetical protein